MINKRGQEGLTLTTLLLIVLGVVVVVVLILFFTGTFDKIGEKVDVLPGNLEAATQACKLAVGANLIADYCYNFKKLSDEQYSNCEDERIKSALEQQGVQTITCSDPVLVDGAKKEVCDSITNTRIKEKIFFNGKNDDKCEEYDDFIGPLP